MATVKNSAEKDLVDNLLSTLEFYAKDAAEKIRTDPKDLSRNLYMNFLNVMYHYTKHSEQDLKMAAAVAPNEELRDFFLHMAKEERGHHILAQEDLKEMGSDVSAEECQEVKDFVANWIKLTEMGIHACLGALYVFENVAKYRQQDGAEILKRLNLKKTQFRWVSLHLEADMEHGQEVAEMCAKYGGENPKEMIYGAEVMCNAWVNVLTAAARATAK